MINASWNIIFLIIVYFFWVETRRLPLEDIALKFGDLDSENLIIEDIRGDVVSEIGQNGSDILKPSID